MPERASGITKRRFAEVIQAADMFQGALKPGIFNLSNTGQIRHTLYQKFLLNCGPAGEELKRAGP